MSKKKNINILVIVVAFAYQSCFARDRDLTNGNRCGCDSSSESAQQTNDSSLKGKKKRTVQQGAYRAPKNVKKAKKKKDVIVISDSSTLDSSQYSSKELEAELDIFHIDSDCDSNNDTLLECPEKSRRAYRADVVEASLPHKPKKVVPTKIRRPRRYRADLACLEKTDYSDVKKSCYTTLAYGFSKYIVPQEYWYTAHSAYPHPETQYDALMSVNKISIVPLIRGAIGFQFDDVPCVFMKGVKRMIRLGFEASFAKKKNAFKATFTDFYGEAPGPRTVYQDINRGTFMFVGNFGIMNKRHLGINFDMGFGLVGGALKNFRLYDYKAVEDSTFTTYFFQGQQAPMRKVSAGGFLGLTFLRFFEQTETDLELSYRVVMNKVQYKNYIVQTIAEKGSVAYTNPAAYSSPLYLAYTVGRNHLRVYSNEFTLAITKNF